MNGKSKKGFATLVADEIRRQGERAELRYDPLTFSLTAKGSPGEGTTINLAKGHRRYRAAAGLQRREVIRALARLWFSTRMMDIPERYTDALPRLLPAVRARVSHELIRLPGCLGGSAKVDLPRVPLAEHFAVSLVYDLPDRVAFVPGQQLTSWGVGFEEVLVAARENLRRISQQPFRKAGPGLWVSPWGDDHAAARLLLPDVLRRCEVRGDLVAMTPDQNTLVLTGSEDADGLVAMASLAGRERGKSSPLPAAALRLREGSWVPFLPEPGHTARPGFQRLLARAVAEIYHAQGRPLEALLRQQGEDVFVASVAWKEDSDTGEFRTGCIWGEGIDSLLPRTDLILFTRGKGVGVPDLVAADWARASEVVGGLMETLGVYPERYRVRSFPTPDQLAAICG